MYYAYILKSEINNSYYIGSCKNISKRIKLHNNGLVKSTKRYKPWELVYKEELHSLKEARQKEFLIKSWKKRSAIENLIKSSSDFVVSPRWNREIRDSFGGPVV